VEFGALLQRSKIERSAESRSVGAASEGDKGGASGRNGRTRLSAKDAMRGQRLRARALPGTPAGIAGAAWAPVSPGSGARGRSSNAAVQRVVHQQGPPWARFCRDTKRGLFVSGTLKSDWKTG